jgi:hypothetical protein
MVLIKNGGASSGSSGSMVILSHFLNDATISCTSASLCALWGRVAPIIMFFFGSALLRMIR